MAYQLAYGTEASGVLSERCPEVKRESSASAAVELTAAQRRDGGDARGRSRLYASKSVLIRARAMPMYEYRCEACEHDLEAIQKFSDPELTDCPSCGAPKLKRQLSQSSFALKGGGWYADGYGPKSKGAADAKPDAAAKSDGATKPDGTTKPDGASKSDGAAAKKDVAAKGDGGAKKASNA